MYFFLSFFKNGAKNKKIKKMTCLKKKKTYFNKNVKFEVANTFN
jgi:hypothetical protein